ncbi:alanine racemase [Candidatus Bathyarchaeota archaeon]|nr:alanine racemase [Candidatus Bathyarchaeota archaeon]
MDVEKLKIRPVWAEIDLNNLSHNIREVRRVTSSESLIMAAVKADAYGHGAVSCAKTFLENGADRLATATLGEAIHLRRKGITAPILCLGYVPSYLFPRALDHDVGVTIYSLEKALDLSKAASDLNGMAKIHVKIDTGMGRLGFQALDKSLEELEKIADLSGLSLEGIFTHFAVADEPKEGYTRKQFAFFMEMVDGLEDKGIKFPLKHVSNSAAIIDYPEYNLDMVRPGIMLYGFYPSVHVDHDRVELKPVMRLKAQISHVKNVPAGTGLSYGLTFETIRESKIATVPAGYADGYSRTLSNRGKVLLHGMKVPIVGRVCMDQFMVDVTGLSDVDVGETITLIGDGTDDAPTAEDLANILGTITHEITCGISLRVPRVYMKDGKIVDVLNFLSR